MNLISRPGLQPMHGAEADPGKRLVARLLRLALIIVALAWALPGSAQNPPPAPAETTPAAQIATAATALDDEEIAGRIRGIFAEIDSLRAVQVRVATGVVTLSGTVPRPADVARAEAIALRVAGVVTVENDLARDLDVSSSLSPTLGNFSSELRDMVRALPLVGIALVIALAIGALGYLLASVDVLWRRVTPNPFLAELTATLVRFVFVVLGLVAGLEVLGATALLGGVLGGAGVIGIALGFAVRDTVDNYVSSLMLSLRQPFRANDHVVIEGHEGRVIRLTSRATILMTLDGNHLRIPNSIVFKSIILNYTRNPERSFCFDLGIDASDNPIDAMSVGLDAMKALDFMLEAPAAAAVIQEVGDSNIVLRFIGWVDQRRTDFFKGRSLAIHACKSALESAGFKLPEPIYRLRFDEGLPASLRDQAPPPARTSPSRKPQAGSTAGDDTRPDTHLKRLVAEERATGGKDDLLDSARPVE